MAARGPELEVAGALERLAAYRPQGFPALMAARERTAREIERVRGALGGLDLRDDASVVLFGSWGRHELTDGSDDDWLVLADSPRLDGLGEVAAVAGEVLGQDTRAPGQQGVFAAIASSRDLVSKIGLDADDNRNLTRRMLLVLESTAVAGDAAHVAARERVLRAYLSGDVRDHRPPRFFLNDLVRYWRTICVDFEGKRRGGDGDRKWAMRNAKLRLSRKVLFAGGLLPILACHRLPATRQRPFLAAQLAAPATDRLAYAFLVEDLADAGARALGAYDRWLGLLGDASVRGHLTQLERSAAPRDPLFREVRRLGNDLQNGLNALLFETRLAPAVREYGLF